MHQSTTNTCTWITNIHGIGHLFAIFEHLLLEQTFYVPRESMRRVLHGKNFSVINKIRKKCEKRLTELYNELYGYEKVTLRLVVKLKKSR